MKTVVRQELPFRNGDTVTGLYTFLILVNEKLIITVLLVLLIDLIIFVLLYNSDIMI